MAPMAKNAGRAQKVEDEEGIGTEGTEVLGKGTPEFFTVLGGFCKTVEDTEGSYEVFLGNKARKGGDSGFPITPAEGAKIQATFFTDVGKEPVVQVFDHGNLTINIAESGKEPYEDGGKEDDRAGLLNETGSSFPNTAGNVGKGRHVVSWQFHDERRGISGKQLGLLRMIPEMMMAAIPTK